MVTRDIENAQDFKLQNNQNAEENKVELVPRDIETGEELKLQNSQNHEENKEE